MYQLNLILHQEYVTPKISKQDATETVDVAFKAVKVLPCSMAMKIIIGPATVGRAPSRPAIEEPHLRPASVMRILNLY
jgi:hypothetical protein